MSEIKSVEAGPWSEIALRACRSAPSPVECPACHARAVSASWNVIDLLRREATIDLSCSSCGIRQNVTAMPPRELPLCYPFERIAAMGGGAASGPIVLTTSFVAGFNVGYYVAKGIDAIGENLEVSD